MLQKHNPYIIFMDILPLMNVFFLFSFFLYVKEEKSIKKCIFFATEKGGNNSEVQACNGMYKYINIPSSSLNC